jgi:hypothetical protein
VVLRGHAGCRGFGVPKCSRPVPTGTLRHIKTMRQVGGVSVLTHYRLIASLTVPLRC